MRRCRSVPDTDSLIAMGVGQRFAWAVDATREGEPPTDELGGKVGRAESGIELVEAPGASREAGKTHPPDTEWCRAVLPGALERA